MRLQLCVALCGLLAVATAFPIHDQRLFVQQAAVSGEHGARGLCTLPQRPPTRPNSPPTPSGLQESPREAFDFWTNTLQRAYDTVEVSHSPCLFCLIRPAPSKPASETPPLTPPLLALPRAGV